MTTQLDAMFWRDLAMACADYSIGVFSKNDELAGQRSEDDC